MKKLSKLLSLFVALCMLLSIGVFASGDAGSTASAEPGTVEIAPVVIGGDSVAAH